MSVPGGMIEGSQSTAPPSLPGCRVGPRVASRRAPGARWSPGSACSCRCRRGRSPVGVASSAGEVDDRQVVGAEREGVEGRADPADAAVGVGDPGVAEVVEPAGQLGRVGAEERELVERVARAPSPTRGRRPGAAAPLALHRPDRRSCARLRLQAGQVDEVVVRARVLDDHVEVADRRHEVGRGGAEVAEERAEPIATGFEASTSGSRSSSVARRLTAVVLKLRMKSGSFASAVCQRRLLAGDRVHHPVEVPDQRGEVVAARGERAGELRAVDDQLLERRRVAGQLGEGPPRGREERVQVLEALVGLLADALRRRCAKPLITFLKSATVSSSRVLKSWSRSTSEIVSSAATSSPPEGISSPPVPSGGSVSSTWRLATPESENERTWAIVPCAAAARSASSTREGDQRVAVVGELDRR